MVYWSYCVHGSEMSFLDNGLLTKGTDRSRSSSFSSCQLHKVETLRKSLKKKEHA